MESVSRSMEDLKTYQRPEALVTEPSEPERTSVDSPRPPADAAALEENLAVWLDRDSEDFGLRLMTCGTYAAGMMGGIFGGLIGLNFRHEWLGMGLGCLGAVLFFLVFRASGLRISKH